ncbi:SDR family NAD(P)-dependent oxidoreductase [Anaerobaca lacustris]|uniref:SDR family NAD(P)-dependent oxidoreductase n=1 Tax=Anaerobaca lacustris TaxID=3044600 RepID=A0AAW6U2C3_9BACT|nr:SDR family NAD(P)-dependent oxidoreductase [Sedimentisphaerales bacterium M17dextr]
MAGRFIDKRVIVTGASCGIGAAAAKQFAVEGACVVLVARRREALETVARQIGPDRVLVVAADVTDTDAMGTMLERTQTQFGGVDVLVNNAGYHARGPLERRCPDELARMIDVNLKAPAVLCRMALPYLRRAGGGAIVNVASLAGRVPSGGTATYCATKFGLRAFSLSLAEELEGTGITVSVVSPGLVDTEFFADQVEDVTALAFSQRMSTAEQIAGQILACAADGRRERAVPPPMGAICTIGYVFPGLRRVVRPWLERRGRANKERYIDSRISRRLSQSASSRDASGHASDRGDR